MKRLVVGILVIIAIVIAAAPFVTGLMMEKTLTVQMANYAERYAGQPFQPQVEITNYQRGYRSSHIEWTITLPKYQFFADLEPIILTEDATHGLTGVTYQASLAKNDWYSNFVNETLTGKDPFSMTGEYSIFSGVTSKFTTDAFDVPIEDKLSLSVKAGQLFFSSDPAFTKFKTTADFSGFSVSGLLSVDGLKLSADNTFITNMIMAGTSQFSIDRVSISNPDDGTKISVENAKVASDVDFNDTQNRLSITTEYSAANFSADDIDVKDFHAGFAINNLDVNELNEFYRNYSKVMAEMMADMDSMPQDPWQAKQAFDQKMRLAGMQLASNLEKFLKKDLQVKVSDVNVVLPQGKATGDVAIGLKKDMTFVDFMVLLQQPQAVTDIFTFSSDISVSKELVPSQGQFVNPLFPAMQTGVFEVKGDQLVHHAEIEGDQLLLNGQEFLFENL